MSASTILNQIITILKANTALTALVNQKIYTYIPQNTSYPYLFISVQSKPEDSLDSTDQLHTVRIQGFSEKNGIKESLDIKEIIFNALNRHEDFQQCEAVIFDVFQEPDGKTYQSVIEFLVN